jgi:GH24 family phage-related lysozyme (muramidase)
MEQRFFIGVVESRQDPLKLGRCQVRIVGLHTEDKSVLPTDKLPWAIPVQSITSAGISGIGSSPVGLVEGSVVKIEFADPDQQQPFIIGSIGGIPQAEGSIDSSDNTLVLKNSDGNIVRDPVDEDNQTSDDIVLRPAMYYTQVTPRLLSFIKEEESLRLNAYQDSAGVWTVGYGTTLINGNPVTPNLVITESQADDYLITAIKNDAMDSVRKNTKALLTQSMFDSLCSFVYNVGRGNYFKSSLRTVLNANKYLDCAASFSDYNRDKNGNVQTGLVTRRLREKQLFLEDGVPNDSGEITKSETPVDEPDSKGSPSAGISSGDIGFKDPKGVYPLYRNEPDTNRLARHENISKTIVLKKEAARERNVPIAGGGSWDQSHIPYNTQYPFNHVYESESGHVMEFDDTKNSERIHIYHKSGTFTEIDANGTQVNRIVGDGYEIYERHGFIHINGNANVTIDGANNVKVGGVLNLDVVGATNVNIYNNLNLNVSGDMNVAVSGAYKVKADTITFESTDTLDMSANETVLQTGAFGVNAGSFTTTTDINLGGVGPANRTGLFAPGIPGIPEPISFSELHVITRGAEAALQYETPEDGDPSDYLDYQVEQGLILEEDINSGTEEKSESIPKNNVKPVDSSCDVIFGMDDFPSSLQLSTNFTLGALTSNGTRKLVDQFGTSKQQIACNLKQLCVNVLEKIYEKYPNMIITSGFRRPGDAANSSPTSDHYFGYAADLRLNGYTREQHYNAIKEIQKIVPYSQLILEYAGSSTVWIHVSYKSQGNKNQVLTMRDHRRVGNVGEFKLIV